MSNCKVEVRSLPVAGGAFHARHLFIITTDASGTEYVLRGGPSKNNVPMPVSQLSGNSSQIGSQESSGSGSNPSASDSDSSGSKSTGSNSLGSNLSDSDDGGVYGTIYAKDYGKYAPGVQDWYPDAERISVAEGPGWCNARERLATEMDSITAAKIPYRPLGPNSNSTVFTALKNIGIEPKVPEGIWAPGASQYLETPARKQFGKCDPKSPVQGCTGR